MTPCHKQRPKSSSALKPQLKRLNRGESVLTVMTDAVGSDLAKRVCEQFRRAQLAKCKGEVIGRDKRGRRKCRRRSARVTWRERGTVSTPIDAPEVRAQAKHFLRICERLSDNGRVWHKELWQPLLASRVGRSTRMVQRYLSVLRTGGILSIWQPPVDEKTPAPCKTKTGRAYNCYQLCVEMPLRLREHIARWRGKELRAAERAEWPPNTAPQAPRGGERPVPLSEAAQALVARLALPPEPD